jgi:uncharacterized protein YeaO (DUF488 family)
LSYGGGKKEQITMLQVYTSQVQKPYNYEDELDITVKTGSKIFCPTWDMVKDYKNGHLTKEAYTKRYYQMMRESYTSNKYQWQYLLDQAKIILCCYCKPNDFCHRYLLADILVKLGAKYKGEI